MDEEIFAMVDGKQYALVFDGSSQKCDECSFFNGSSCCSPKRCQSVCLALKNAFWKDTAFVKCDDSGIYQSGIGFSKNIGKKNFLCDEISVGDLSFPGKLESRTDERVVHINLD